MAKERQNLEARIAELEAHLAETAKVATATATIVNILIKKTGLTHAEITAALHAAALEDISVRLGQSEGTGTDTSDRGVGNAGVSGGPNNGDATGIPQHEAGGPEQTAPNGIGPVGHIDPKGGDTGGSETEGKGQSEK